MRKLIFKRMAELGSWDLAEVQRLISCYETVIPLTEDQRKIIYIDLLFPINFTGMRKTIQKNEVGEVKKLLKSYKVDAEKLPVLRELLKLK
ncbi:hypothetical protein ACI2OX_06540 [Bacillus sp. N9]